MCSNKPGETQYFPKSCSIFIKKHTKYCKIVTLGISGRMNEGWRERKRREKEGGKGRWVEREGEKREKVDERRMKKRWNRGGDEERRECERRKGRYKRKEEQRSWEPEGRYHHRVCAAIALLWFSMEHLHSANALLALNWRYAISMNHKLI